MLWTILRLLPLTIIAVEPGGGGVVFWNDALEKPLALPCGPLIWLFCELAKGPWIYNLALLSLLPKTRD